jgi:hypothetical protein
LSDLAAVDRSAHLDQAKRYACSLEEVQRNLRGFDFIAYHRGWIPAPFAALADCRFRLVHIDVDLYQPTRDSFEFFFPRLAPNGVMIFDDYGTLKFPGARRAIDECLERAGAPFFMATPAGQGVLVKRAG